MGEFISPRVLITLKGRMRHGVNKYFGRQEPGNALTRYMVDSHWTLAFAEHETLFNSQYRIGHPRYCCGHFDPAQTLAIRHLSRAGRTE